MEKNNTWTIKQDGDFTSKIKTVMENDDYSEEAINTIIKNGIQILLQCPEPIKNKKENKTGIVIGKVQSGKTSNFITLMALAFDNDYQICIVLGGNKINLLKQNVTRIKNFFKVKYNIVTILDTNKNKDLLESSAILDFIKEKRKIIIIGLKHQQHINNIANIFVNEQLSSIPTIIIDDEGDQATLNTKRYSSDLNKNMSVIYKSILNLKSKLNTHCFISITATPQANILIDTMDKLSPDFGHLISPGKGYCGLVEFHGEKQDKFIKVIAENEQEIIDNPINQLVNETLAAFFVSNGIRKYRGDNKKHALLFHISQLKSEQNNFRNKLQSTLNNWKNKTENKEDIWYESLKKELLKSYNNYVNDGVEVPIFDILEPYIINSIQTCSKIHLYNSDAGASENWKLYQTNIFVGGNMVERGLTIKGLAITYIIRRAKTLSNIDNTQQRARWFGYKQDYLDICRVFTTKQIKDDFHDIYEHDDALWDTIEKALKQGIPFKEIRRVFINNNKLLRLTRTNVAKTKKFDFDQFKSQNKIILNESIANENNLLLENIKINYQNNLIIKTISTQKHMLLPDLPFSYVKKELFDKYKYPSDGNLVKSFFDDLQIGFEHIKENPKTDIMWVRYETKEERNINIHGVIESTLMQGYSPNLNSINFYIGDRKLPDERPNNIQVQIHLVKPNKLPNIHYYSPCFVIYIPTSLTLKLSNLITVKP